MCLIHVPVVKCRQQIFKITGLVAQFSSKPFELQKEFGFKIFIILRYQDNIEFTGFVVWVLLISLTPIIFASTNKNLNDMGKKYFI